MKKSDKKIENAIREALTNVCDAALESIDGFVWLTHVVNYSVFPSSLKIVCVFETHESLSNALDAKQEDYFYQRINEALNDVGIKLNQPSRQVSFDTEEACERFHNGKWNERLARLQSSVTLH